MSSRSQKSGPGRGKDRVRIGKAQLGIAASKGPGAIGLTKNDKGKLRTAGMKNIKEGIADQPKRKKTQGEKSEAAASKRKRSKKYENQK